MGSTVKIGPDIPAGLSISKTSVDTGIETATEARPDNIPANAVDRGDGTYIVRTEDTLGNTVESIYGTKRPHIETPAELKARIKEEHVDANGNLVSTY